MKILPINNNLSNEKKGANTNFKAYFSVTDAARNAVKQSFINSSDPGMKTALECLFKAENKMCSLVKNKFPLGEMVFFDKISKEELAAVQRIDPGLNPKHVLRLRDKYVNFFFDIKNITQENLNERVSILVKNLYNSYKYLCEKCGQKVM